MDTEVMATKVHVLLCILGQYSQRHLTDFINWTKEIYFDFPRQNCSYLYNRPMTKEISEEACSCFSIIIMYYSHVLHNKVWKF